MLVHAFVTPSAKSEPRAASGIQSASPLPDLQGHLPVLDGVRETASEFLFGDADAALVAVDDFLPHDLSLLDTPNVGTDGIITHI